jgi:preprotein translocase subunit SecD
MAMVGCSSGGSKANTFSIRAVNGEQPAPCPAPPKPSTNAGVLPFVQQGKTVSCLQVAQAVVTQKDVTEAKPIEGVGTGWDVEFALDGAGADALNRLAVAEQGKQLATEVDGVVYSEPSVHTTDFHGRGSISRLDEATAKRIASEMKPS